MTVELEVRSGWYYAVVRRPRGQGRAVRQALRVRSEPEARAKVKDANLEQIATAAQADALTREVWTRLLAGRHVRVREAITAFRDHRFIIGRPTKSVEKEQLILGQFVRFHLKDDLANASINAVDPRHIAEFANRAGALKLSTRTWQLQLLNTWLEYCVAQRWIVKNPAYEVVVRLDGLTQEQLVNKPHVPFTEGEMKTLLATVPTSDYWHGAILLAYEYGLSLGTVATLEESNVVAHQLRVYRTKGKRVVNERLTDPIIAWLDTWRTTHRPSSDMTYLFPAQAAAYLSDPAVLSKQFGRLCADAGISGVSFHSLRKNATDRCWNAELAQLGTEEKRQLTRLIVENGYRRVQQLLAHAPGSEVTAKHYIGVK